MGSISSQVSVNYPNARWQLDYEIGVSNLGITNISYDLKTLGRNNVSPSSLATICHMYIYDTNNNLLESFEHDDISNAYSFTTSAPIRKSGEFNVIHNSSGKGSFKVVFEVQFYPNTSQELLISSETINIPTISYAYTNCSAPTSVTASGIVAPNGEVTVSWSGASSGISNSIKGYEIYWRITSEGSAPSTNTYTNKTSVSSTSSSGSTKINIGNATRGYIVVFGVVTKGSAGSSYYSGIATGGNVKINSKPTKPLGGTVSPTIIPAAGGTVAFTVSPGNDSDGQAIGLRYATTLNPSDRIPCAPQFSLNLTAAGTYYFWSNDGLEDSDEYITISVSSNTKPTITINVSGTPQETVNSLSGAAYILNPTITLTQGNNGQQDNNTYNYYIHYSTDKITWKKETLWEKDSSLIKTVDDIRTKGYFINLNTTGYYYYFSATRHDGLDISNVVDTSENMYYVSKRPSLKSMFNTQDYKNIESEDFQEYFSKALSFTFDRDTGYNSLKIYNGTTEVKTIPLIVSTNDLRGQWLGIDLSKGSYTFTGEIGYASSPFYTTKMTLGSSYKIENLKVENLWAQADFQVYTSNITYDFSIYNTFNVEYDELTASKYKEYGILNITDSFYAKLKIDSVEGKKQSLIIAQTTANGNSTTSDTLYFSLTAAQLYAMLPTTIDDKNKTYTAELIVGFRDIFDTNTETSIGYIVNYGVVPECSDISIKVNNSEEVNTWTYLKESMPLTVSGTIKSYNTNPLIQIQINRIKNNIESGYVNFGDPINLKSIASSIINAIPNQDNPTTYIFSNQKIITIGELTELDYQINFRVKIITDANSKYHFIGTKIYAGDIKVCGHTSQGAVTLNEANYSSAETTRATSYLNYRYTNIHPGAIITDDTNYKLALTAKLQYKDITESNYSTDNIIDTGLDTAEYFKDQSGQKRQVIFSFPENADALICRLVITTTQTVYNGTESYTTTKVVYSNEQTVYNILPTVSYRKNLLGINATNLNREELQNAVLVIGEHSSKNIIYFVSSTGLKFLNTSTGELNGFIVDGGEW